ncbi:galactose-binding domain-containing protein [Fulvivirga ligni]|uniref:galactose-binding domain-containing protein n=1 Tax=Fulvivirga ligni TaxID=2904246 RepID=UPI001F30F1C7|nr:discoidin domain-containing protein [Fulvivirga ligni]UII19961.1 discoidin domain-containing protein [Fulvivirga ligni]
MKSIQYLFCLWVCFNFYVVQAQNIALNKPVTSSTTQEPFVATSAVDGNATTRWASAYESPSWIKIDLQESFNINRVLLNWERASAESYYILTSNSNSNPDPSTWTVLAQRTGMADTERTDNLTGLAGAGRYIAVYGYNKLHPWGYSFFEIEVYGTPDTGGNGDCGGNNVALNGAAVASSMEGAFTASSAFDGSAQTRWSSEFSDNQWIRVDLGQARNICQVELVWEAAFGSAYNILLGNSTDIGSAQNIASVSNGDGGTDQVNTNSSISGRYLWMQGVSRGTGYGYSLWEMRVFAGENTGGGGDTQAPSNPGNVTASAAVYAVTLNWSAATDNVGVSSYTIYEGSSLKATVDGSSNSMTISGLNPGTQYTYLVKAKDAAGNESSGVPVTFTTEDNNNPDDGVVGVGNLALSLPVTASSTKEGSVNGPSQAVDGNIGSRWESEFTDDEWIRIDLGQKYQIGRVILHWEAASAKHYQVQVSDDDASWQNLYEFNENGLPVESRTDDLLVSGAGRYIRMKGIERNSQWSYSLFEFEVYSPGSGPGDWPDPNPNPNPDPVPPGPSTFTVIGPNNGAMITTTRTPQLSWNASPGATSYEVWVNITRTDYDWYKWGSLLDRFTKMGEVTSTSYTLQQPLSDRWTYKWYIVAKSGSGLTYSDVGQFSVYLPQVEQVADNVNLINGNRDMNKNGSIEPYEDWRQPIAVRVADLMSRMNNEEKAYQMFYNAQNYPLSGWAFGPGTVSDMFNKQKASANTRLGIPFVSAGDCIHGYSTTYPTQSALAASRNLELTRQCGNMQRVEQTAVGFRGTLAPLAEVGTKVLYPRIQEGCGEDADFAAAMVRAMVCGLQAGPELNPNSVMVTTKHWPGEGAGGEAGIVYDGVSIKYHMKPWFANVDAGAGSVMPGYAGSSFLDPGGSGAGDSKPILDYLREVVKFEGIICTDWLPSGVWAKAALAGSDVMGGADPGAAGFSMQGFINEVGMDRINEALEKILTTKFKLGVFEDPYGDPENGPDTWFTPEHIGIATQAAKEAMNLIKNDGTMPLDLPSGSNLLVTGSRADNGESYSVWTSYFHDEYGAKTMWESINTKAASKGINAYLNDAPNPDAAVVILGEPSYTHGTAWDKEKPYVHDAYYPISNTYEYDLTTLNNVKQMGIPYIVVVIMPRPYVLTDLVADANAVLIAYRPGDGGGPAVADVLFGEFAPKGRLPWQLPRSMDQIGLDNLSQANERWDIPYDLGASSSEIQEIKAKIAAGEHIEPIYGNPLFQYGYGIMGYGTSNGARKAAVDVSESLDEDSEDLILYPNPVNDQLNVRATDADGHISYQIIDTNGRTILKGNGVGGFFTLSIGSLKEGFYILRVAGEDGHLYSRTFKKE